MSTFTPLNLKQWIEDNRHLLKPPVGNQCIWKDSDFIVMIVAGPNQRKDFHVNPTEEFFHQLEGDIVLRIREDGATTDVPIREGEVFLLPPRVPHSPQRPAGTLGMVVERRRPKGADDHLQFYCDQCGELLYTPAFYMTDIARQLKPLIERFWNDESLRTCEKCGAMMQPPGKEVTSANVDS